MIADDDDFIESSQSNPFHSKDITIKNLKAELKASRQNWRKEVERKEEVMERIDDLKEKIEELKTKMSHMEDERMAANAKVKALQEENKLLKAEVENKK